MGLILAFLVSVCVLSGCASAYVRGQAALREGRFEEAATDFERALAQNPDRTDALVGLGMTRYKQAAFDEAAEALRRAVALTPRQQEARLYLGLSYLRKGQDGLAEEQLTALADLKPHRRLAAQIDRALRVLRVEYPLSDEVRSFLAASLEDEADWEREVRDAQLARPVYVEPFGFYGVFRCFRDRFGRPVCL